MKKPPNPVRNYVDPVLGEMHFSDEDETWVGCYNGYEFRIAYEMQSRPHGTLLSYCREMLHNASYLEAVLVEQKRLKKGCYRGFFDDEIDRLRYLNLMFYRTGGSRKTLAQLVPDNYFSNAMQISEPGDDRHVWPQGLQHGGNWPSEEDEDARQRLWRIEFCGQFCQGLDFDY